MLALHYVDYLHETEQQGEQLASLTEVTKVMEDANNAARYQLVIMASCPGLLYISFSNLIISVSRLFYVSGKKHISLG